MNFESLKVEDLFAFGILISAVQNFYSFWVPIYVFTYSFLESKPLTCISIYGFGTFISVINLLLCLKTTFFSFESIFLLALAIYNFIFIDQLLKKKPQLKANLTLQGV